MVSVVFVGNCQIQAVHGLYRQFCTQSDGREIHYVRSYDRLSEQDRTRIADADILVEQVQKFKPQADAEAARAGIERITVPLVHCGFFWPFAGQAHPHNPTLPHLPTGPYGAEMSDGFLNRHIKRQTPPEAAVADYLALNVNAKVALDRLLEVVLEKQQERDAATGFDIATLMAEHFRTEQIFLTPYHPNLRIAQALASQTLARLGVPASELVAIARAMRVSPFPRDELPVHPAVARHWGLDWAGPDRRYTFLNEGGFTFGEYALRYMRCEWNVALEEGLAATRARDWANASDHLADALHQMPDLPAAHSALAHVLENTGQAEAALEQASKAAGLQPDSAAYRLQRAVLLERMGVQVVAEQEFRLAAALDAYTPRYPAMLARFLMRAERHREARAIAEAGLACVPRDGDLLLIIGEASQHLDGPATIHGTWSLPDIAPVDKTTGESCERSVAAELNRLDMLLGANLAMEALAAAQTAFRRFPGETRILHALCRALQQAGRHSEEVDVLRQAVARQPDDGDLHSRLGDALIRHGDDPAAEQAFQKAVALLLNSPHILGQLGYLLDKRQDHDGAIAARQLACEIDPSNPHRRVQLGHVLTSAKRFAEAEKAVRAAIALRPGEWISQAELAEILSRAGRAAAVAHDAIALAPGEPRALALARRFSLRRDTLQPTAAT